MMIFLFELAVAFALGGVAGYYVAGIRAYRVARRVEDALMDHAHKDRAGFRAWAMANRISHGIKDLLP